MSTLSRPLPKLEVRLTEDEDRICVLLDDYSKKMKESTPEKDPVMCRIAGGWVRDKLLGNESNDIDIALSSMTGFDFANGFVDYLGAAGHEISTIALIAENPEQSKHLATAKTKILGYEIDFVNLRSETYAEGSRIPSSIKFGTPLEDALRRDITINALFYNVHERAVEDFTGKGLDDLRDGIIRTPLPPKETFMDDPLRVLRCIRFASRLGFHVEEAIERAVVDPDIKEAISLKISRDRIGEELDKMMKGRDPLKALVLLHEFGLYNSIFWLPSSISSTLSAPPSDSSSGLAASKILHMLLYPSSSSNLPKLHPSIVTHSLEDESTKRRLFLASALVPFRGLTYVEKKKKPPAVEAVIREGLKLGTQNHYLDGIPLLFQASSLFTNLSLSGLTQPSDRVAIGTLLRNKAVHNPTYGAHWSSSILFSLVMELLSCWKHEIGELDVDRAKDCITDYNGLASRIEELGLSATVEEKPRLDGREITALLGISPGPAIGTLTEKVVEWQLEHPEGSKDECSAWLKGEVEAGRILVETKRTNAPAKGTKPSKRARTET